MSVVWTEEAYGTGVPEIDEQHRTLFDRVNALLDACEGDRPEREITLTLEFLTRYTVTHFLFEERWMRDHGCPGGEENRRAHTEFVIRLDAFRTAFNDYGPSPELMSSFSKFLTGWITGHIEKIDVKNLREPSRIAG